MNRQRPSAAGVLAVAGILLGFGIVGLLLVERLTAPAVPDRPIAPAKPKAPGVAAAPVQVPAPARRAIPERLPDLSLADLKGVAHRLADYQGRPLIVNFWASWCEPCRREIPLLKALRRENSRNDLEIVGIGVDQTRSVQKFVQELGIDYPVLVGEKEGLEAVSSLGMDPVLPFTVFADSDGRIITLKIGELHRDEASFILARLADLRASRIDLAAARQLIASEIRRLSASRTETPDPQTN